jgi:molecular chaperone HtpG
MISEDKFYDRGKKFSLLKNTEQKYFTLDEYKEKIKDHQTDKDKKLVYLYATDADEQHSYIESALEKGYDVLMMDGVLDKHFINTLEQKFEDTTFARVDADTIDKLIKKSDDQLPSKLDDKQKEKIKPYFEEAVDKSKFTVVFDNLSESDLPVLITQPEFMRRMKDMSAIGGGGGMMGLGNLPDSYNLVVNANHPLVYKLTENDQDEEGKKTAKQLSDLALLSQNLLKGKALTDFIKRSVEIL